MPPLRLDDATFRRLRDEGVIARGYAPGPRWSPPIAGPTFTRRRRNLADGSRRVRQGNEGRNRADAQVIPADDLGDPLDLAWEVVDMSIEQ